MTNKQKKKAAGRPTKYSKELADEVCALIAEGESVRHISLLKTMPDERTIYRWLIKHEGFCQDYARAKEIQMDKFNEDIVDIADDGRNDWVEREDKRTGKKFIALDAEHIARAKLRVETRKWLMGKHKPNKYGDFSRQEITGKNGAAIETKIVYIDKEEKKSYQDHIKKTTDGD